MQVFSVAPEDSRSSDHGRSYERVFRPAYFIVLGKGGVNSAVGLPSIIALQHTCCCMRLSHYFIAFIAEEHKGPEIMALNPRGQVPTLVDGDVIICESVAALLYLEDAYPEHTLLPSDKKERASVG